MIESVLGIVNVSVIVIVNEIETETASGIASVVVVAAMMSVREKKHVSRENRLREEVHQDLATALPRQGGETDVSVRIPSRELQRILQLLHHHHHPLHHHSEVLTIAGGLVEKSVREIENGLETATVSETVKGIGKGLVTAIASGIGIESVGTWVTSTAPVNLVALPQAGHGRASVEEVALGIQMMAGR